MCGVLVDLDVREGKGKLSNTQTLVLLAATTAIVLAFVQQDVNEKSLRKQIYTTSYCTLHKVPVPFMSVWMWKMSPGYALVQK